MEQSDRIQQIDATCSCWKALVALASVRTIEGTVESGWPLASFRARCPSSRYNKSEKKEARGTGCAPPLKAGQSSPSYQLFESILLCPNHGKMTWLAQGTAKPDHTVGDNLPKTAEPTLDMTCP